MAYSFIHLLEKLIMIEQQGNNIYKNTAFMNADQLQVKSIAMVLAKEEERHIRYYTDLKNELGDLEQFTFSDEIYQKAAWLVTKFRKSFSMPDNSSPNNLIQYALDLEKRNVELLEDIQRYMMEQKVVNDNLSHVFQKIIQEEQAHIKNLEVFIR